MQKVLEDQTCNSYRTKPDFCDRKASEGKSNQTIKASQIRFVQPQTVSPKPNDRLTQPWQMENESAVIGMSGKRGISLKKSSSQECHTPIQQPSTS
jgi:hypothetical protein